MGYGCPPSISLSFSQEGAAGRIPLLLAFHGKTLSHSARLVPGDILFSPPRTWFRGGCQFSVIAFLIESFNADRGAGCFRLPPPARPPPVAAADDTSDPWGIRGERRHMADLEKEKSCSQRTSNLWSLCCEAEGAGPNLEGSPPGKRQGFAWISKSHTRSSFLFVVAEKRGALASTAFIPNYRTAGPRILDPR